MPETGNGSEEQRSRDGGAAASGREGSSGVDSEQPAPEEATASHPSSDDENVVEFVEVLDSADEFESGDIEVDDEIFVDVEDPDVDLVEAEEGARDEAAEAIESALRARIEELEQENKQTYERMLRVAADAENLKRRTEREKEEIRRYGAERLLLDLIPVLDNLERALTHSVSSKDQQSLMEGVQMVHRQFKQALAKYGCESFESVGKPFDPQRHEAVQQVESAEHEHNTVLEEYQKGYLLNNRLIRPAMVVVSRLPASMRTSSMETPKVSPEAKEDALVDDKPIAVDTTGEAREVDDDSSDAETSAHETAAEDDAQ